MGKYDLLPGVNGKYKEVSSGSGYTWYVSENGHKVERNDATGKITDTVTGKELVRDSGGNLKNRY